MKKFDGDLSIAYIGLGWLPSTLPKKINGVFNCSHNKLTSMLGSPEYVKSLYDCSSNLLRNLLGVANHVGSFNCSRNELTSLKGSPKTVDLFFECFKNNLISLIGAPSAINGSFDCNENDLISLNGLPKFIGGSLWLLKNNELMNISDIWNSKINGKVHISWNNKMALLPLIKFKVDTGVDMLNYLINKHEGGSKQNIISFQYDLIENGFGDHAKWEP